MNKEIYPLIENDTFFYTFISNGRNGNILKAVVFQEVEPFLYNLVLADFDPESNIWSDTASTNNGDIIKILATVLQVTDLFLSQNENASVLIEANTNIKNLLYNRIFRNHHIEISQKFEIRGQDSTGIEIYSIDKTYFSFYIYNKKIRK